MARKSEYEKLMETPRGRASLEKPVGRFFGKTMRECARAMLTGMKWEEIQEVAASPKGHSAMEVIVAQKLVFDRENPRFMDVNAYMKLLGEDKIQIEVSARDEAARFFQIASVPEDSPQVITAEECEALSKGRSA